MWPILIVASIVTGCFALARRKRTGSIFGAEGVATIEEARYAKNQLKRQLFANANVPWWLVGVGIGGSGMSAKCQKRTHALQQKGSLFDHLAGASK